VKLFRAIVVTLFIAGLIAIAQHHHDDCDEHEECAICALVHDGLDYTDFTPQVAVFWILLFSLPCETRVDKGNPQANFERPRGPPAFET